MRTTRLTWRAGSQYQGTGDWNYYKLFIENNLKPPQQAADSPSSFHPESKRTKAARNLRKLLTTEHTLLELTSFENRGYAAATNGGEKTVKIFPDVDNRFQVWLPQGRERRTDPKGHAFDARFISTIQHKSMPRYSLHGRDDATLLAPELLPNGVSHGTRLGGLHPNPGRTRPAVELRPPIPSRTSLDGG